MPANEPVLAFAIPADEEYRQLEMAVGLITISATSAAKRLSSSWCAVRVGSDKTLVGMGRVVGDGGGFLSVVDVAVLPLWQGRASASASWPSW